MKKEGELEQKKKIEEYHIKPRWVSKQPLLHLSGSANAHSQQLQPARVNPQSVLKGER